MTADGQTRLSEQPQMPAFPSRLARRWRACVESNGVLYPLWAIATAARNTTAPPHPPPATSRFIIRALVWSPASSSRRRGVWALTWVLAGLLVRCAPRDAALLPTARPRPSPAPSPSLAPQRPPPAPPSPDRTDSAGSSFRKLTGQSSCRAWPRGRLFFPLAVMQVG